MQTPAKILIGLDGSDQSLVVVRYIGRVIAPPTRIVLFHVRSQIPEAFKDLAVDPSVADEDSLFKIWRDQQEATIDEFLEEARSLLIEAGIPAAAVTVKNQPLKAGVARDILAEAHRNYTALVIGRTGVGKFDGITMGSVASKLVEAISQIPIVVVGEQPESNKILIAVDGSMASMKATSCAAALLNPAACEVMLCHVIRPLSVQQLGSNDLFLSKKEADWISVNQQKIVPKIVDAKRHLMAHGFTADHISSEILTYQTSRAGAIAQAAATGSFDTIVLGRRGFTSVEAFKIGRVCRKIIHFAYRPALWIVN